MEFQNRTLRVPPDLEAHLRSLLTPRTGAERMLEIVFEELGELVDRARPPRWLLLAQEGELELLAHLATPMFTAQGHDADEYMGEIDDDMIYVDSSGDAYLRADGEEYDLKDRAVVDEVDAYLCRSGDLLAEISWFEDAPDMVVFVMIMRDAETAYAGSLDDYTGANR